MTKRIELLELEVISYEIKFWRDSKTGRWVGSRLWLFGGDGMRQAAQEHCFDAPGEWTREECERFLCEKWSCPITFCDVGL